MAEPTRPTTDVALELRLRHLAVAYPATPDVASIVAHRLGAAPPRSVWQRLQRRTLLLAPPRRQLAFVLAAILVALAAVAATPATRDAVAHFFGIHGVVINQGVRPLPSIAPRQGLTPGPESLDLGQEVTLSQAKASVRFPVLVPTDSRLGATDRVFFDSRPAGGEIAFAYLPRPGFPAARATGIGLLVSEFAAGKTEADFFGKILGPDAKAQEVTVGGSPGYWISGAPHAFFYQDRSGQSVVENLRLASDTLLWEKSGATYRIEGDIDLTTAQRIAASMR